MAKPFVFSVEAILFPKQDGPDTSDGYTIARGKIIETGEDIVCKGRYGPVVRGQEVEVTRYERKSNSFGPFIQVWAISHSDPTTEAGVVSYLQAKHGTHEIWAKRIVAELGPGCLEKIDKDPEIIRTIGEGTSGQLPHLVAERLVSDWHLHRKSGSAMEALSSLGLSDSQCKAAIALLGSDVAEKISEDPYVLCQVPTIPFKRIDGIALKAGIKANDPRRLGAGLSYIIASAESDGHICLQKENLLRIAPEILSSGGSKASKENLEDAAKRMTEEGLLVEETGPDGQQRIYTKENWVVETRLLAELQKIRNSNPEDREKKEKPPGSSLTDEQWSAVRAGMREPLSILTGGPGCGKTYTLRALLDELDEAGENYVCLSPTGKAAKRMEESTGREARTIHSTLGFDGMETPYGLEDGVSGKVIGADVVIVDEASMLDMRVAERLLTHTQEGGRIVFVGDPDQLPAVGAGSVLHDLIECGEVPTTRLSKIFRQGESSLLVLNAHRIREGKDPYWSKEEAEEAVGHEVREDWKFVETGSEEKAREVAIKAAREVAKDLSITEEEVMLTSGTKKGGSGVFALNKDLQEQQNPGGEKIRGGDQPLRVGDVVMNTKNRYASSENDEDIMNGDGGKIKRWDKESKTAWVDFGFGEVPFSGSDIENIIPAYAATTHKLQGSEFPGVVTTVASSSKILSRNLLYTAQTRASEMCVVVGSKKSIRQALKKDGTRRNTTLDLRIAEIEEKLSERASL